MNSTVDANGVLRRHMLFISAPLSHEHSVSVPQSRFSRTILVDTRHESVLHASRHLEILARSGDASSADELREAFVTCCSSTQRFPVPEVGLVELMEIFHTHMRHHTDDDGALPSEYILRALCTFFVCERSEAQQRYVAPLIELGVLQSVDATRYVCVGPHPPQLHHLPLRELLSRFVCIFCHQTCMEGGNELIYLSHSRWVFAPRPSDDEGPPTLVDSPFSPFPEALRRGLLGSLMQFATAFCISDCRLRGVRASDVCIVKLDGLKLALCQLAPSNVSLLARNSETGALDRRDCPVTALFGFPADLRDAALRVAVQRLLDAAEMRAGPRADFSARLAQSPRAFRRRCRALGRALFRAHSAKPRAPPAAALPPRGFALAVRLLRNFARAVAPCGNVRAAVLIAGAAVVLRDAHAHISALLAADAALELRAASAPQPPRGAMADDVFGGASDEEASCDSGDEGEREREREGERERDAVSGEEQRENERAEVGGHDAMWGRTVRTASGAVLRVRWRYFSAALVRLLRSDKGCVPASDSRGKYFRTVYVASSGVQFVMIVGDGMDAAANAPWGNDAEWCALMEQCLSVLVAQDYAMETLAAAVEHKTQCRGDEGKRTESSECLFLAQSLGSGCEKVLSGTVDCPPAFARDTMEMEELLGTPLVSAGNVCSDVPDFAFEHLPITRVVLGRGAFGARGATLGQRAGGEDRFFAPPQGTMAGFARVEEEFAAFMKMRGAECDTVF